MEINIDGDVRKRKERPGEEREGINSGQILVVSLNICLINAVHLLKSLHLLLILITSI